MLWRCIFLVDISLISFCYFVAIPLKSHLAGGIYVGILF